MAITLRHGAELNIKWTFTISFIFHIIVLSFLISYSSYTKRSPLNSIYTPFTAVQVNLVDTPNVGLTSTIHGNVAVRSQKSEVRSEKQEVRSQKQEVRSKRVETGTQHEDAVKNAGSVPPLEVKKQGSDAAAQGSEVRSASVSAQTGLSSKGPSGTQVAGLTTPWAQTAGPAVDATDFKYDYYLGLIRNKVDSRWNQPVTYSQLKKAVVEFKILRNGIIEGIKVSETSGDTYFDQTVIRAVSVSSPFPPLPKGYKENFLKVRYKFVFGDNGG